MRCALLSHADEAAIRSARLQRGGQV